LWSSCGTPRLFKTNKDKPNAASDTTKQRILIKTIEVWAPVFIRIKINIKRDKNSSCTKSNPKWESEKKKIKLKIATILKEKFCNPLINTLQEKTPTKK